MPTPIYTYATAADLTAFGVNADAVAAIIANDPAAITDALAVASSWIDGYLRTQFVLPLVQAGNDMRRACAILAAYDLLVGRGFNPAAGADEVFVSRYWSIAGDPSKPGSGWLAMVAAGKVVPDITDSSPTATEGVPAARARMVSSSQRGYSGRQGTQQTNTGTNGPFTSD